MAVLHFGQMLIKSAGFKTSLLGRILGYNEKLIKNFYQEIFYWDTDNTKAPTLTLDIATIAPRIFY